MTARHARADSAPPASMGRRFAAALLDVVVWCAVGGWLVLVGLQQPSDPGALDLVTVGLALTGVLVLVQWVLHGRLGWTLGRLAVGIRTLDVECREPIGVARVLVRGLVIAAGFAVLVVGGLVVLASPLFDPTRRHRGWHDRAARDEVLDVRPSAREPAERPARPTPAAATTVPAPALVRRVTAVPDWAFSQESGLESGLPAPTTDTGSLVLAPLAPNRSGPDLDTRAIPVVRPPGLADGAANGSSAGLATGRSTGLPPELELTRPAVPSAELITGPPPTGRPAAEFELADGRRVTVERTALVGRNPASGVQVQLVRVADPNMSVSKTHLQIGVETGGVWVADRGSTNGTMVTLPDGGQVVCGVDQQVRIRVGSTVVFGDCSMRLVRVPEPEPAQ